METAFVVMCAVESSMQAVVSATSSRVHFCSIKQPDFSCMYGSRKRMAQIEQHQEVTQVEWATAQASSEYIPHQQHMPTHIARCS